MSDDWNQGDRDDQNLDNLNDIIGDVSADNENADQQDQQHDAEDNAGGEEQNAETGESLPESSEKPEESEDKNDGAGQNDSAAQSTEGADNAASSEDSRDEDELNKAIEEEELDEAISEVADAAEEDEEYLVTTDWEWVADIIRFLAEVQKSKHEDIAAISKLFYEKEEPLKPLALAEAIEVGVTERAEMTEFILRDMVKKSVLTTDPAQIRASIMELANWAYNVADEDKRFIHQAATAIAESFPKKVEKTDENGEVIRGDDGAAVMVNVEFVPKRTTKNTAGDEIIALLEELHAAIDTERVTEFTTWYDKIMAHFLIES